MGPVGVVFILRGPNGDDARAVCGVFAERGDAQSRADRNNQPDEDGPGSWTVEPWRVQP